MPSRTIFVANLPFDVSEEQLASVFSEVGPIAHVEIKFDAQTGRPKGYAFVQYHDEATAASAVRNLHEVRVNGRNLRVEPSSDEAGSRRGGRAGGGAGGPSGAVGAGQAGGRRYPDRDTTPPRGPPGGLRRDDDYPMSGEGHGPPPMPPPTMAHQGGVGMPPVDMSMLPSGRDLPPGQKATDAISRTLATINPGEMQVVMSSMKSLIEAQPEQARLLLQDKPQLAYALFQAMLLMNIVDPSVLQRITPMAPAPAPGPPFPPSNPGYPPYPPTQAGMPPPPRSGYRPPPQNLPPPLAQAAPPARPPIPPGIPASAQAQLAVLPEDQRAMLIQILQFTPEQVENLDPTQKGSIIQLRRQFLGTA